MGKINWGRVLLGGVIWSVVDNVLGATSYYLFLRDDWIAELAALGRPFRESAGFLAFFLLLTLIVGIWAIWLYAAIRPRYGPGPKTAACAGLALWVIGGFVPWVLWGVVLSFPARLLVVQLAAGLVAIVAATVVGAWQYQEP